ncbi:CoxG family protein [Rhizobium lusitanum]|uniref:CoxG family protein n=1 Tax=Rhizobium lusitanum TaxID=293958 RepID=UPI00157320F3|nr:carbon monoxide dehydrogenase subunit G [Rhizobium lusitanum]NTJ11793.1 carbon monoxide dehydrogenase subunit G [Rhizobium lusitanum]
MSMSMQGEIVLNERKEVVWELLRQPDVLKACIPGCDAVEKTSDTTYDAVVRVKLGPVSAKFRGNVTLTSAEAPDEYLISGKGDGGIAGMASGEAKVKLSESAEGTLLTYSVEAQVNGKMIQMGSRLINSVMRKMTDEFFANFAIKLA